MGRRLLGLVAVLLATAVGVGAAARPAAATHQDDTLWVTIAINAAGGDRLSVTDDNLDSTRYASLASDVAIALDRAAGSFRSVEDLDGAHVLLHDRLIRADGRGRLSYSLDTGKLQVLAQRQGYDSVIVEVCTPRVRQVVDALVAPESDPGRTPGSRCRGWYQMVEDPPIRAEVQLMPDRSRYPWAVGRVVGAAAIAFGVLGIGATLLRRGPLRRRSWPSWLLSTGAALAVLPIGWAVATFVLWWSGATADPMLLGGGTVAEQVGRVLSPGLVFLLPALLPGVLLLSVPRKERKPPPPWPAIAPAGPPAVAWWPAAWWPQWAAQGAPPEGAPQAPPPASAGPSGWDPPGSTGG